MNKLLALLLIFPLNAFAFGVDDIPCRTYLDGAAPKLDIEIKYIAGPTGPQIYLRYPRCVGSDTLCFRYNLNAANAVPTDFTKLWSAIDLIPDVALTDSERLICGFAVNRAPVAQNGNLTIQKNQIGTGTLIATDEDNDPLTFSIVSQPAHGTVTLNSGATQLYSYIPLIDYVGADAFSFNANDGTVSSSIPGTVTLTIVSPPPPPPPPPPPTGFAVFVCTNPNVNYMFDCNWSSQWSLKNPSDILSTDKVLNCLTGSPGRRSVDTCGAKWVSKSTVTGGLIGVCFDQVGGSDVTACNATYGGGEGYETKGVVFP